MSVTDKIQFKRRKLPNEKKDPLKDLIDLYAEEEREMGDEMINGKDDTETKSKHDLSLKRLIEANRSTRRKKVVVASTLLLLCFAGAALAGFFYFSGRQSFNQEDLKLSVTAPEKVKIGEPFEYLIKYENAGQVALNNARLTVQLPTGFFLEKSEPALTGHELIIGDMAAAAANQLSLAGKIIDSTEEAQTLGVTLSFEPSNFHSTFSKNALFSQVIEAPDVEFVYNRPANVTLGQKASIKLKLKNKGEFALENARMQIDYPENFSFKSASPAPVEGDNVWVAGNLEKMTESKEINLEGSFPVGLEIKSTEQRTREFAFSLLLPMENGQYAAVKKEKFAINIIDQPIGLSLFVNGSADNKSVELGNSLAFSLSGKNNGQEAFKDLEMRLILTSDPIDILNWNRVEDKQFGKIGKTDTGKQIVWDKKQIPALGNLAKGKSAGADVIVPIKMIADFGQENIAKLGLTVLEAQAEIVFPNQNGAELLPVQSGKIRLVLDSNINIGGKALYYFDDGTPIGEGPIPFRVGKPTKLKVFWDLSNDIHEMENVSVSASLPDYVKFTGDKYVTAGDISFDESTRKVTWAINRLPEAIKESHASFTIEVTPQAADAGKIIKLTGNTTLSAKDVVTNNIIIKTKNIITSALEQDGYAKTDGVVVK